MACESDNHVRILDAQQMTWTDVAGSLDPTRVPFPPTDAIAARLSELDFEHHRTADFYASVLGAGGTDLLGQLLQNRGSFCWITDRLFYSKGHLVLRHSPNMDLFCRSDWLHVLKLEGEGANVHVTHLYSKDLKNYCPSTQDDAATAASLFSPYVKDVAVSQDGTLYFLRQAQEADQTNVSYLLQSVDIGTGNCLASQIIRMPQAPPGASQPRRTNDTLLFSGDYLLFCRSSEETRAFPGIGLGVYAFRRANLSQTCYLRCFEEGEVALNMDDSGQTDKWIFYYDFHERAPSIRKFWIDRSGILTDEDQRITFRDWKEIKFARGDRVFVEIPDEEGCIFLDEFDAASGEKIRTISTGVPRNKHTLASVLSNGNKIFCIVSARGGRDRNVIQSFLI